MKKVVIGTHESGRRLDRFLERYLSQAPKSFLYKMLRKKNIVLNDMKASGTEILKIGDTVTFWLSDETLDKFRTQAVVVDIVSKNKLPKLKIIYEDEQILLMDKAAGVLSQKAQATDTSINEMMLGYLLQSQKLTQETMETFRPSVCNRLDRNTSGLIAGGKTLNGLRFLTAGFRTRYFHKYYFCLVKGNVKESRKLKGYLIKNEAENRVYLTHDGGCGADYIETEYEPIAWGQGLTLLKVLLITGRSHQIRVHLANDHHPIIGDMKYGDETVNAYYRKKYGVRRQLLHAGILEIPDWVNEDLEDKNRKVLSENVSEEVLAEFAHVSGMRWQAPLPDDFKRVMSGEHMDWQEAQIS